MRLIDADKLSADMYHEAFEKDSDMQKWDSGCWIRYKMFENVLKAQPTVEAPDINVGNMDTTTNDSIPAETGKNDADKTTDDLISRQVVAKFLSDWLSCLDENCHKQSASDLKMIIKDFKNLPSVQPERKTGHWILDRSGAYCCSNCMEPCASYAMMKPRDRYCKMCGSRNEVTE